MKHLRQNKILELIEKNGIETQGRLALMLTESGYEVTQATISRDIKELQLIKVLSQGGKYIYAPAVKMAAPVPGRLITIFREAVKSLAASGNIIVVKTLPGCAGAAAEAIDGLGLPHLLGTVANGNTVMAVADDPANVPELIRGLSGALN